jgi:hypothetical protein
MILAGMAGNVLEWYDFSVYGFFAESIGQNFFPSHSKTTSLMEAFAVFAAGFLMRPFGALLPAISATARDASTRSPCRCSRWRHTNHRFHFHIGAEN